MRVARLTEPARNDLRMIAYHIGVTARRPEIADRIVDAVLDKCDQLAEQSETVTVGKPIAQMGVGVRVIRFKRWVIIFRYEDHGIDVLRIADQSQDYMSWQID